MPDLTLSAAIRAELIAHAGITTNQINTLIGAPLKESDIDANYAAQVGTLYGNRVAFAAGIDTAVTNQGGVWTGNVYNLLPLGLVKLKMVAAEELSAIRTHAATPGFDAGKALTNMLRLIKAAER